MKILDFIICDDIRNEMGGKISLMGIYQEAIEFQVTPDQKDLWPKSIKLGFYIKITTENIEEINTFVLAMKSDSEEVELGSGPINIPQGKNIKTINIIAVHPSVALKKAGAISFLINFYKDSGTLIESLYSDFTIEIKERVMVA